MFCFKEGNNHRVVWPACFHSWCTQHCKSTNHGATRRGRARLRGGEHREETDQKGLSVHNISSLLEHWFASRRVRSVSRTECVVILGALNCVLHGNITERKITRWCAKELSKVCFPPFINTPLSLFRRAVSNTWWSGEGGLRSKWCFPQHYICPTGCLRLWGKKPFYDNDVDLAGFRVQSAWWLVRAPYNARVYVCKKYQRLFTFVSPDPSQVNVIWNLALQFQFTNNIEYTDIMHRLPDAMCIVC